MSINKIIEPLPIRKAQTLQLSIQGIEWLLRAALFANVLLQCKSSVPRPLQQTCAFLPPSYTWPWTCWAPSSDSADHGPLQRSLSYFHMFCTVTLNSCGSFWGNQSHTAICYLVFSILSYCFRKFCMTCIHKLINNHCSLLPRCLPKVNLLNTLKNWLFLFYNREMSIKDFPNKKKYMTNTIVEQGWTRHQQRREKRKSDQNL